MSKAFTREDNDAPEEPVVGRPNQALPAGATNWMTADGAARLREELRALHEQQAGSFGAVTWKRALAQRAADLNCALDTATIVAPPTGACEEVRFGAWVKVRERDGTERAYRIVGVDETDPDRGWVSWVSPLARALLGAKCGQQVTFRFPTGEKRLAIMEISDAPPDSHRPCARVGGARSSGATR
ncbi:MAG: GreA/GreB family elongation factor [Chthoniobacteraceae bacterium]